MNTRKVEQHAVESKSWCEGPETMTGDRSVGLSHAADFPPGVQPAPQGKGESVGDRNETLVLRGIEVPPDFVPPDTLPARPDSLGVMKALAENEKYQLVKVIGSGGMGTVYLANHREM